MKKRTTIITIVIILIVVGVLLVISKQRELAALPKAAPQPTAVQTATVENGTLEVTNRQIGEIQPYVQADLAPRITGHILSVTKHEGDSVTKGETVGTIDYRELENRAEAVHAEVLATRQRLAGAKSVYETQRSVTERDEKLYAAGAISKESLERSRSTLDSAKSVVDSYEESIKGIERTVEASRLQVAYSRITAPFSGVVTKRWAEPGDLAVPGKAVLTIQQPSPVKVVVQIPQELMGKLAKGMKLTLTNGADSVRVEVTRVYPALNKNLLGSVEAVMQKSPFNLPCGSTVNVDIIASTVSGTIVPDNATVRTEKGTFLYLVDKGIVHVLQVSLLGVGSGKAVVKGEIPAGAQVAVAQENKLLTLSEGMQVMAAGGKK
jgi:RND family efflux transporter MFP subunit